MVRARTRPGSRTSRPGGRTRAAPHAHAHRASASASAGSASSGSKAGTKGVHLVVAEVFAFSLGSTRAHTSCALAEATSASATDATRSRILERPVARERMGTRG